MTITEHTNRETYLEAAIVEMRPAFEANGFPLPAKIKATCGWPSKSAGRSSRRRIGECWSKDASAAGNVEIIISMALDDTIQVLDILTHECVHAAVGNDCGHRGPFRKLALALGLEGKMTATTAGPELLAELKAIEKRLGKYPHAKIDFSSRKKQSTRMIKVTCHAIDCGMIFRTSNKWIDQAAIFNCPACSAPTTIG